MSPRSRKTVTHGKGSCGRFTPRSGNTTAGHCQDLIVESICVITLVIGCIIFSLFYLLTQLSSRSAPSSSVPTRRHRSRVRNIDHNRSSSESKIQPVSAAGSTRDFEHQNIIRRERSSSFDRRQRVNQSSRDSINEELEDFKRNKWKSLLEESFVGNNGQMRYIGMSPSESLENIPEEKIQLQTSSNNPQSSEVNKENMIPKFNESKDFVSQNESSENKTSYKDDMELESKTISEIQKTELLTKHHDLSKDQSRGINPPNRTHKIKTDVQISNNEAGSRRYSNDNNEEALPDTTDKILSSKPNDEQKVYNNIKANSNKLTKEKHDDTESSPKIKLNYPGKNHNDLHDNNDENMISVEPHVLLDSIQEVQDSQVNRKTDGIKSTLTSAHDNHKIEIKTTEEDKKYENSSNKSGPTVTPSKKIKNQENNPIFPTKQPVHELNFKDVISDTQKSQYSKSLKVIPKIGTKMEDHQENDISEQKTDRKLSDCSKCCKKIQESGEKTTSKTPHETYIKATKPPVSPKKYNEEKHGNKIYLATNIKEETLIKPDILCGCDEPQNSKRNEGIEKNIYSNDSKPLSSKIEEELNYKNNYGNTKKLHQEVSDDLCGCDSTILAGEVKNLYAKAIDPPFLKLDSTEEKSKNKQVTHTKTLAKIEPKHSKSHTENEICGCDDSQLTKQSSSIGRTHFKDNPTDAKIDQTHTDIKEKSQGYEKTKIKEELVGNSKPNISDDLCGCDDSSNKKQKTDQLPSTNYFKETTDDTKINTTMFNDKSNPNHEKVKLEIKQEHLIKSNSDDLCGCDVVDTLHQPLVHGYDKTKIKEEPVGNSKPNISDDLCGCDDSSNKKQTTDKLPSEKYLKETTHDTKTNTTMSNDKSNADHEKVKLEIKQEHLIKSNSDNLCGCDVVDTLQPLVQKIKNGSSTQFLQHRIKSESNGINEEKKEMKEEKKDIKEEKKEMKEENKDLKEEKKEIKEEKKEIKDEKKHMSAVAPEAQKTKTLQEINDLCGCDETTDSNKNQLLPAKMYGKSTELPLSQIKIEKQEMPNLEEASMPQPIFSKSSKPPFPGVKLEMKEKKDDIKTNISNIYAKSTTPPFLQVKKEREKTNSSRSNQNYNDLIQKKNLATKESPCSPCNKRDKYELHNSLSQKSQSQINAKLSARSINSSHSPKNIRVPLQEMSQFKTSKGRDDRVNKAQFGKNIARLKAERQRQSLRNSEKSKFKAENPNLISGCSKNCLGVLGQMSKDQLKYFEDRLDNGASHKDKIDLNGSKNETSRSQSHLKKSIEEIQNSSEGFTSLLKKMAQQDVMFDCDRCRSDMTEDMKSYSNNTTLPLSMTSNENTFERDIIATSTPNTSVSAVPLQETCNKEECKENMKKTVQK